MLNWKFCCWWLLWLWIVMGKFCGRLSFSSTDQNDNLVKFTWSLHTLPWIAQQLFVTLAIYLLTGLPFSNYF